MNTRSQYDVAIIGAGMSGLAAGIRLAHFGKRVCIFERHNAPGGLNGFYSIAGRKFDVGLHALTNFVPPGVKGTPLVKLLRQLRIDRDEFDLCPQKRSRIAFGPAGEVSLRFSNDFALLESEVASRFPAQIDGFRRLSASVRACDDVSLDARPVSARGVVRGFISDRLLEDMLFCPLMYYGSATERDMDFGQFSTMFKALFFEGFARPFEGVRTILRVLLEKYRSAGGERRMKCGVKTIRSCEGGAVSLILDNGEEITADQVLSSIGSEETRRLISAGAGQIENPEAKTENSPPLSFVETITVLDRQPAELGWGEDTIVFFNDSERFRYERPEGQVDLCSGVICLPNNFDFGAGRRLAEGWFRCTCLARYESWIGQPEEQYRADKRHWYPLIQDSARRFMPRLGRPDLLAEATRTVDMFTPRTIERYTGHLGGGVYGAAVKQRQGSSGLANVHLCGTDQGFLGIIGAMLSGISMANYHILRAR